MSIEPWLDISLHTYADVQSLYLGLDASLREHEHSKPVSKQERPAVPQNPLTADESRGVFTRVAEKLGVSVSMVSLVARGKRRSERVAEALMAEYKDRGSRDPQCIQTTPELLANIRNLAQQNLRLGLFLYDLRKRLLNITQEKMARLIGVLPATVGGWESGRYPVPRMALLSLGREIGVIGPDPCPGKDWWEAKESSENESTIEPSSDETDNEEAAIPCVVTSVLAKTPMEGAELEAATQRAIARVREIMHRDDVSGEQPAAPVAQNVSTQIAATPDTRSQVHRLQLYKGVYLRVAKALGVNISTVSRVARGQRSSARIASALNEEYARLQALAAPSCSEPAPRARGPLPSHKSLSREQKRLIRIGRAYLQKVKAEKILAEAGL